MIAQTALSGAVTVRAIAGLFGFGRRDGRGRRLQRGGGFDYLSLRLGNDRQRLLKALHRSRVAGVLYKV